LRITNHGPQSAIRNPQLVAALLISATALFSSFYCPSVSAQSALMKIIDEAAEAMESATIQQPSVHDADETVQGSEEIPPPKTVPATPVQSKTARPSPAAETTPPQRLQATIPLVDSSLANDVQMSVNRNGRIDLIVRDTSLSKILALLAQTQHLNIVAANDIDALISITLRDVPVEEALTAILAVANYTWVKRDNIILVTSLTDAMNVPADVQGRQIQVFDLDFASAKEVSDSVTNFLSPAGKVTIVQSDPADNRLTQERVIVEDLPESLARIAQFICQIDHPPRQVLIEAHVLQVNLDDNCKCGVNLDNLVRISGSTLNIQTTGFAVENAPQAFLATLEGGDLGGVIELLQTTTDSKSLGSPKLLVLNEQQAEFQVGEKLGYRSTTTTETSTMESVQFLNVGVVLGVTPRITRDNRILMHVEPKVSTGDVVNDLPNEKTTELHTDVILNDGQGMIIGGLIKETDSTTQQKVPYLGEVRGIGWLFRRTEVNKERVEIIIALVPRIQPYDDEWQAFEQGELVKAGVPLMHGPLCRNYRPYDPILPDGKRVYRPLIPRGHGHGGRVFYGDPGPDYVVPQYPFPKQHFYGDCGPEHGREIGPELAMPESGAEQLPPPGASNPFLDGSEIISDQP
jgi:type II secretory pathway component GspD/PulD (secretin)